MFVSKAYEQKKRKHRFGHERENGPLVRTSRAARVHPPFMQCGADRRTEECMDVLITVAVVVVVALIFDFTNGFHDTANAMATSVATGALKPRTAVAISAVLNLVGAFLSTEVAQTISGGVIKEGGSGVEITPVLIFAGLVGAVLWNLATWYLGLPSSSTHALFGGLIGAAVIGAGLGAVDWGVLLSKVIIPALLSPVVAGLVAMIATYAAYRITKNATTRGAETGFRHGQTVSPPWSRWPTARTTRRRPWVSSR
jgi:PiT family inorganic phosphate transporter